MRMLAVAYLAPLVAIAACSSGPETAGACVDRFSDNAEFIDFLENEQFGATYTYEFNDFDTLNDLVQDVDGYAGAQYHIADGKAYLTVLKAVPLEQEAVVFGCNSAPEKSRLVGITRERLPSESNSNTQSY